MTFQTSFHNVVYPTRDYQDGYVCIYGFPGLGISVIVKNVVGVMWGGGN